MVEEPRTPQDAAKSAAARQAVEAYVRSGMRLGLGSGTTSFWFVRHVAEAVRGGLEVVGVPTSTRTRDLALELGVPLGDLDDLAPLDLTVDGADEIDPDGAMIKGGGGALLSEKIVATASARMVAVVDEGKVVDALGAFPLPVEVVTYAWRTTRRKVAELLAGAGYGDVRLELRGGEDAPFVTDGGHYILDAHLERVRDTALVDTQLNRVPGVVEHGLFVGVVKEVVIGRTDGTATIEPR